MSFEISAIIITHQIELVVTFLELESYTGVFKELLENRWRMIDYLGTGVFHSFSRPRTVSGPLNFWLFKNSRLEKDLGYRDRLVMLLQVSSFLERVLHNASCDYKLAILAREFWQGNNQNVVLVGSFLLYEPILVERLSYDTFI